MDFWHGACTSVQQVEDKNCFVPPLPPWISSKWTVSCSGICSRISRTFSPLLLFLDMIIRSSRGRLVELPAAVFVSLRLKFPNFVTLISTSANCLIKNVRTNETGAHKDQDVIKYSEACWSFIGHVMYLTELDGVGELHYRFDDFTKCVKRELNFHFQNLTHIHSDACNYTDSSPTIQS